ncbi:hypothetical protein AGMMS49940_15260 [Spirochaetia bacterium]|nr:hypothetical protein AGMMS49940_15260 [Spirochaetia bacterium]
MSKGFALRPFNNHDGTDATPNNLLCGYKPMDLDVTRDGVSILSPDKKGTIILIRTTETECFVTRHIIDCSGVANLHAASPQDIITLLNTQATPALPDMVASYNNTPRAVNLYTTNAAVLITEIYGELAGAMGFGGGEAFTTMGSFWTDFMTDDSAVTLTPTPVTTDATQVRITGGYKSTARGIDIGGGYEGMDYAINVAKYSPEIQQALEGGYLLYGKNGTDADFIPFDSDVNKPRGKCEMVAVYERTNKDGVVPIGTNEGLIIKRVYSGTIIPGADTTGAVTMTSFNATLQARVYRNQRGQNVQQPKTLYRGEDDKYLNALTLALQNRPLHSMLEAVNATTFTVENSGTLPPNSTGFELQAIITPPNASGFVVSIAEPGSGALGCTFEWDDANQRVLVTTGLTTGTETVTATLTNADGSTRVATFTVIVGS